MQIKPWSHTSKLCLMLLNREYRDNYKRFAGLSRNRNSKMEILRLANEAEIVANSGIFRQAVKFHPYIAEDAFLQQISQYPENESFMQYALRTVWRHEK